LVILNEDTLKKFSPSIKYNECLYMTRCYFTDFVYHRNYCFYPLREFIPGYSSSKLKRDATELALKSDSLTLALQQSKPTVNQSKSIDCELEYTKFNKIPYLRQAMKRHLDLIVPSKKNWN
jgi:hypothetical protein